VFLHGTTWPSKHWPEADWRAQAGRLSAEGWAVRLHWGGPAERERGERIAAGLARVEVLPKLNNAGAARVLARPRACVAVYTGLGHLAAALEVLGISLYGPPRPGRVGAYGKGQVHLCAIGPNAGSGDREKPCFDGLGVERVYAELQALMARTA